MKNILIHKVITLHYKNSEVMPPTIVNGSINNENKYVKLNFSVDKSKYFEYY